ncbi:uncharacterized protein YbbC (DUF1343 family) [Microbulbifer hydrolyticus]|uniref:D-alanyl-D-alanine dipeptidase n=2 Tax=Microbulbifer hydrolyticus TaxID=48074 RepID=A0AA89PFW5_9GAMM|nr:exo-beta-N-acetylmuramidase NamZ domain-containing protein [Microbulbifer hydrolyticus]MBB5210756.1 uncharacterized protein YbbC (DUF1343 family) [Microbulbifer hydrolyticus]
MKQVWVQCVALIMSSIALGACQERIDQPLRAESNDPEFVAVSGDHLKIAMRYVTPENLVGQPLDGYRENLCMLTPVAAEALKEVAANLAQDGLGLELFDCYRPQRAVDHFVRWAAAPEDHTTKADFYPREEKSRMFERGYIAERSGHSRGATVDLTLYRLDSGEALDMGTGFDFMDERSATEYPLSDTTARANRLRLRAAMEAEGFTNYAQEWWHYTFKPEPYPDTYFDVPVTKTSLTGEVSPAQRDEPIARADRLRVGAEQPEQYLPLLRNQSVGLVVNQTSRVGASHLIDFLRERRVGLEKVFALEHGVRGNVENGGKVDDGIDGPSGLPIVSLYGGQYAPAAEDLAGLDWLVFDIQDVGVRFYTYISSLHYLMQACADHQVPLLVLDRPNPNGDYIDGPVLEKEFQSFVGMHPIPLVHGMTVGELAQMINGEGWLEDGAQCALTVIPVAGYRKNMAYSLPVRPSPNLPNDLSIRLYPSLGLFEGTTVSVGRGTEFPFQALGHPSDSLGEFAFIPAPVAGASENPKHNGKQLHGDDLREASPDIRFTLEPLVSWSRRTNESPEMFFSRADFFDKLAGTDQLREAVMAGSSAKQIRASWQPGLVAFRQQRQPYLLYPED